ncbi:hypothetical protein [Streptomyces europaeiscabiei]|uniref:hypothetical protein n=1 Tax=Streptomyces europaeiscabiei TaxID=146819 RepID=UPI001FD6223E|nr:hypothetical protein [Streptomyces europaeiscabiei]
MVGAEEPQVCFGECAERGGAYRATVVATVRRPAVVSSSVIASRLPSRAAQATNSGQTVARSSASDRPIAASSSGRASSIGPWARVSRSSHQ